MLYAQEDLPEGSQGHKVTFGESPWPDREEREKEKNDKVVFESNKSKYKTFSLFLICNPEWILPSKEAQLRNFFDQFKAYGRALGKEHIAVWYWQPSAPYKSNSVVDHIDYDVHAQMCSRLGLLPSEGPHIIVTDEVPTPLMPRGKILIRQSFSNRRPEEIARIIAKLTDVLRSNHIKQVEPWSARFLEIWRLCFVNIREAIGDLRDSVTLTIDSGPVEVEIEGTHKDQ
jgi:hypothetical protein